MATPITFRNVAAPNLNPNQALSNAISGFSAGAAGFSDLTDQLREGKDRSRAELTNKALGSIMADGRFDSSELGGLPEGVDVGSLVTAQAANQTARELTLSRGNTATLDAARINKAQYDNSEPVRKAADELRKANLQVAQDNSATAKARQKTAQQNQQRLQTLFERDTAQFEVNKATDIAFDDMITRRMAPQQLKTQEALAAVANDPSLTDEQRTNKTDDLNNAMALYADATRTDSIPSFMAERRQSAPGTNFDGSNVGALDAGLREAANERALVAQKSAIEFKDLRKRSLSAIANSKSTTNLSQLGITDSGELGILSKEAAAGNKMGEEEAYRLVRSKQTFFSFLGTEDEEIKDSDKKKINAILKQVGGNRQMFEQVMVDVRNDLDFGTEDEVENLPTFSQVAEIVQTYRDAAGQLLSNELRPEARTGSATSQLFQAWANAGVELN